jgi:hypothetical protein
MSETVFVAFVRPRSEPIRRFSSCSTDFSQQIAQVVRFLFLHVFLFLNIRIITSNPPTSLPPKTNKSWGVCGWQKICIGKGSWKTNRFSASQEILYILWNPWVHYRIHKCPQTDPTLRQLDSVDVPTSHFLNIRLNIMLPSTPGFSKWSLSLRFQHQNPVYGCPLPPYVLHAPNISFFAIWSPEKYWVRFTNH